MTRLLATALTVLAVVACTGGAPPSPSPTPSPPSGALYLRAWVTQALPPPGTFGWGPMMTISNGVAIDFNVAVPAIFPGPAYISPNARGISPAGEQSVVNEARALGLLSGQGDFTGGGVMPGGQVGHISIIHDGITYQLTGDPARDLRCEGNRCAAEPGTPDAFAAFWRLLSDPTWLEPSLGPSRPYSPERIAALVRPVEAQDDFPPNRIAWPVSTPFDEFGLPFGGEGMRCGIVSGDDVRLMLGALQGANQLTIWVDSNGAERSMVPRALVPDEPSPCDPVPQ